MKTRISIINILAFFILLLPLVNQAQSDWRVSEEKQKDSNPVAFTSESIKAGETIYLSTCKACHGDMGAGNALPLVPKPTDLGLQAFLDLNSDGSIFHKITDGKGTMASYQTLFNDEQRWNLVNYIRSHDAKVEVPQATITTIIPVDGELGPPYSLDIQVDEANAEATITFFGTIDGNKVAIPNAEIFVGVKRYFNNLPIVEAGTLTNEMGMIKAKYPSDLKSGEEGKGEIIAYPKDKELYGDFVQTAEVNLKAVHIEDFSKIRALWRDRAHFPIWLMVTYLSMVLIAWGVMFKVVLNLLKIKKIGN